MTMQPSQQYPPQTAPKRQWMGACLAIIGALSAFACVASIVAALLLPSIYRSQRPELQAIWCNRAERVGANFVCDWKPTVPADTLPTVPVTPVDDPFAILTPATSTPDPSGAQPAATESGLNITPAQPLAVQNQVTNTPTPTITVTPTASTVPPTAIPTATPSATPTDLPVLHKLDTGSLIYQAQTWNNCGPATLSMAMSYFGYRNNQSVAARFLKPNGEDKNVSPYQMVNYVNQQASAETNIRALYRVGGDLDLLRLLLLNEFPVIIEKGYDVQDLGWMGHYLLMIGYDDNQEIFYTYDSFLGHGNSRGLPESYTDVSFYWQHFNYTFIVIYPPERQQYLLELLGELADPVKAAEKALATASAQAAAAPEDNWAWFNIGHSYSLLEDHVRAAQAFDRAFSIGMPWRTLWYLHMPYQSYYATGRYEDILSYAASIESNTVYVEETFYYRGIVLATQGDSEGAIQAFTQALTYNNNYQAARVAREAVQNGTFTKELALGISVTG